MPIIPMPPTREEWLTLRQKYVGASEVAALFGVQARYQNDHFALHHIKAGHSPAPPVDGPRVRWGKRLEHVIAEAVEEEYGYKISPGRYAIADDCPGMAASLDFELASDPTGEFDGPGVLETKNVAWMIHRDYWTGDEPPIHVILQLQDQLGCTNYKWGAVAGLVGGNTLNLYRYPAKPRVIADIKVRITKFWSDIRAGNVPDTSWSESSSDVLRSLYPDIVDDAIDMSGSNEWSEACAQFITAQTGQSAAKKAYDGAKNRIVDLLQNHMRGWGGGYAVNTSITAEKEARPARPDEMIPGRKETRRYTVKMDAADAAWPASKAQNAEPPQSDYNWN